MATSFEPHQTPESGSEVSHKWYVICGKRSCPCCLRDHPQHGWNHVSWPITPQRNHLTPRSFDYLGVVLAVGSSRHNTRVGSPDVQRVQAHNASGGELGLIYKRVHVGAV